MITMLTFQLFLNTRTATRLRAAVIATVYRRAINVRTLKGKSAAEVRVCLRVLLVFTELGTGKPRYNEVVGTADFTSL